MLTRPLLIFALLLELPECIFSKSLEYVYADTLKEEEVILETSTGNLSGRRNDQFH